MGSYAWRGVREAAAGGWQQAGWESNPACPVCVPHVAMMGWSRSCSSLGLFPGRRIVVGGKSSPPEELWTHLPFPEHECAGVVGASSLAVAMAPHLAEVMGGREENPTSQRVALPLGAAHCLPAAVPVSMLHHTDMSVLLFSPASIPLQLLPRSPSPPQEAALSRAALGHLLQGHGWFGNCLCQEVGGASLCPLCPHSLRASRVLGARRACRNTIN